MLSTLKETIPLYTNIPKNIPKYTNKYTNTNYTQTGGKENALTRQTFALYKIQNLHTILSSSSSFSSPSLHATTKKKRKEKRKQDKIQLDVFCVPHFVFLMRHDLYIYIYLDRTYHISYLMSCCLLHTEIYPTYIYTTYCCVLT